MTIDTEWRIPEVEESFALTSEDYLHLEPMVNQVAYQEVKNSYIFEVDDIVQELWMFAVARWDEIRTKDDDLQFFVLQRYARTWCAKQRVEYMHFTGAYLYTPKIIRERLDDSVFCDPADAMDVDARVDITQLYDKLSRGRKASIYKRYALKEPYGSKAEEVSVSEGVTMICDQLNLAQKIIAGPLDEGWQP
jgi:DNA-directed RNA polymerase specialized sigma24 family protein